MHIHVIVIGRFYRKTKILKKNFATGIVTLYLYIYTVCVWIFHSNSIIVLFNHNEMLNVYETVMTSSTVALVQTTK